MVFKTVLYSAGISEKINMSPSKYKLTYFSIKAVAEPIRFLLSYGGVEFEDIRYDHDVWPTVKNSKSLCKTFTEVIPNVSSHAFWPDARSRSGRESGAPERGNRTLPCKAIQADGHR